MTIRRAMHCSHWGAYSILVDEDRIVGVEPFEHDPAPSPINQSVCEWAQSERRVSTPLVRTGWLERRNGGDRRGRGSDKFVPVSWDEVTSLVADESRRVSTDFGNEAIFVGSYGWTSCGRLHHASSGSARHGLLAN